MSDAKILTQQQELILRLASTGLTNKEIASKCLIQPCTVRNHLVVIFKKLKAKNRMVAAIKYFGNYR